MSKADLSILFFGRKGDAHCDAAAAFLKARAREVSIQLGDWGDPFPTAADAWQGDLVISYLSRWVIPQHVLDRAKIAAINFHPASPDYPGIGSMNFALYDGATEFGITCHHMARQVDTGGIIATRRFPILPEDTVASLLARTYEQQLALFTDVMTAALAGQPLPVSDETWTRAPYTRKQLNALSVITPDMTADEVARRVRATTFGPWKPTVSIGGFVFELKS